MIINANALNIITSPVRIIKTRVEVFNASTLAYSFNYNDKLIDYIIERTGEDGLFFGFGICQSFKGQIIDINKEVNINAGNIIKVSYLIGQDYIYPHPPFIVTQTRRDEITNKLTIYGYDVIFDSSKITTAELELSFPYSINDFALACALKLGAVGIKIERLGESETCFNTTYPEGANFEGTESIRDALNDIAEVTQTIYFINSDNYLVFKRLDKDIVEDFTISKNQYFSLTNSENRRLQTIASVTELGDNISASTSLTGTTQYVKDNAFWDLREDRATLVDNAVAAVGNISINQFECDWRGNFLLELGDKIALEGKESTFYSFLVSDSISYDGTYAQSSRWAYDDNSTESESNSTSLGEVLKQTYAKVDKANKTVEILVSENAELKENVSQLFQDTESINASVKKVETTVNDNIDAVNSELETLITKVNATMTSEEINIAIQKELENGVSKVETTTGFIFDDTGLTINKSGSEMKTTITEDGMKVYRDDTEVLVANNIGVEATNLHATTYLIIGSHSRFEDYGDNRTGCFWIG